MECLSDVQVAEKKLFLIQGDKPQLMNWEKYGLRIGVQEHSFFPYETAEIVVVALVGGQFQFPHNTVLVSAVYAVSLSKPLLKPQQLEIQHCIDLTGRPDLARYLKFAIAPINTHSVPYQFSIVEGGVFTPGSRYGSILRAEFCLVCILMLGDEWEDPYTVGIPEVDMTYAGLVHYKDKGTCTKDKKDTVLCIYMYHLEMHSTGVKEATNYAGLIYYEEKGAEDLVTFTAAKNLNALLEVIYNVIHH